MRGTSADGKAGRAVADRPIRVLVATQPALWSEVLAGMLDRERDIKVVGRALNEEQVRQGVIESDPHVVLLDYEALGPNSEDLVARLHRTASHVRILVFATRSGDDTTVSVLRAGAAGLVGKQLGFTAMLVALRTVANGELWVYRHTAAPAFDQLLQPASGGSETASRLTKREWEVVEGVGKGLRNREIARTLGISERTVKCHLNNIFAKMRVNSRLALTLWARGENKVPA